MQMQMLSLILILPMKTWKSVSGRPGLPICLKYICDLIFDSGTLNFQG